MSEKGKTDLTSYGVIAKKIEALHFETEKRLCRKAYISLLAEAHKSDKRICRSRRLALLSAAMKLFAVFIRYGELKRSRSVLFLGDGQGTVNPEIICERKIHIMKKVTVKDNQRGLLFKNGKYIGILTAGKYRQTRGRTVEICFVNSPVEPRGCSLETLLADKDAEKELFAVTVPEQKVALIFKDGKFINVCKCGKYAFWKAQNTYEAVFADISYPLVGDDVPRYVLSRIPENIVRSIEVPYYAKGVLSVETKTVGTLDPGTYYFWQNGMSVDVVPVDMRKIRVVVAGQELLTRDKVSVRISYVCNYRVTDCVRFVSEVADIEDSVRNCVQLALREYVTTRTFEELLSSRKEMSDCVFAALKEKEEEFFVEFSDAGVRDVILPGEIREIMNTVLIAEKQAQANVIKRRDEYASVRAMMNTAKIIDSNPTVYKLKQLEYLENICAGAENLNIGSSVADIVCPNNK